MNKEIYKAIGLMSGTSLDGVIDVALIETDGKGHLEPLEFYAHPYAADIRDKVRACFGQSVPNDATKEAEQLVTDIHIEAVKASGFNADIIGFHGQTIMHDPENAFTWQLGDGARLALETGIDVINDMRQADMAAGGQGAPLAPLYHAAMVGAQDFPVAVLNIGGVSNVTYIGEIKQDLIAFDCGPGNALMDDYVAKHFDQEFDQDGMIAESGKADRDIVDLFLSRDFFKINPPKSLDRNDFVDVLELLPDDPKDGLATLAVCSAVSVMVAVKHMPKPPHIWYICGGGRKNGFLMQLLGDMLLPGIVKPIEDLGFDGDAIEAQAFAYLAVRSLRKLALTMPGTTGVVTPQTGGVYHKA